METKLKRLSACASKELVRLEHEGKTKWAIVGQRDGKVFFLTMFTEDIEPHCQNVMSEGQLKREFEDMIVLSYGTDNNLEEQHDKECNVSGGPLFQTPGSIIHTEDARYLCCKSTMQDKLVYFNLETGEVREAILGNRAAFAEWILWPHSEERGVLYYSARPKRTERVTS
jgi:hypothetical protein